MVRRPQSSTRPATLCPYTPLFRSRKENPSPPKPSPWRGGLQGSELRGEIHADRARFVDEAGQVVEVDAADDARGVGDVAAEQRHFVIPVAPVVADAPAALERGLALEPGRLVQEEVHSHPVPPVGLDAALSLASNPPST